MAESGRHFVRASLIYVEEILGWCSGWRTRHYFNSCSREGLLTALFLTPHQARCCYLQDGLSSSSLFALCPPPPLMSFLPDLDLVGHSQQLQPSLSSVPSSSLSPASLPFSVGSCPSYLIPTLQPPPGISLHGADSLLGIVRLPQPLTPYLTQLKISTQSPWPSPVHLQLLAPFLASSCLLLKPARG